MPREDSPMANQILGEIQRPDWYSVVDDSTFTPTRQREGETPAKTSKLTKSNYVVTHGSPQ